LYQHVGWSRIKTCLMNFGLALNLFLFV